MILGIELCMQLQIMKCVGLAPVITEMLPASDLHQILSAVN
jgi:hypothetical protein